MEQFENNPSPLQKLDPSEANHDVPDMVDTDIRINY